MNKSGIFVSLFLTLSAAALEIHPHPIVKPKRLALTRAYCKAHYGLDGAALKDPQIIVVHDTEIATLAGSFKAFAPDELSASRREIAGHGDVNVGVHFLVDRDGQVYSLLPLDVIGRHAIGFNYTAVGIENVGFTDKLTPEQIDADAALIADLKKRLPTLKYLIGHYEYIDKNRSHYKLYRELDPKYAPTVKADPGRSFMSALRDKLEKRGLRFDD